MPEKYRARRALGERRFSLALLALLQFMRDERPIKISECSKGNRARLHELNKGGHVDTRDGDTYTISEMGRAVLLQYAELTGANWGNGDTDLKQHLPEFSR